MVGILFSGLIGLSVMPHQEARFLCPLLVPLVLIYTWKKARIPKVFWITWILFNIITTYVFGVVHQGGIIPAMGFLQRQTTGLGDCQVLESGDLTCTADPSRRKFVFAYCVTWELIKNEIDGVTNESGYHLTTNLLFYKTYMAPRHLLVIPQGKA